MKEKITERITEYPRNISCICGLIEESSGVSVCVKTVQRVLKASDFGWKRIRLVPKGKPDPEEYEEKKKQLKIIREQEERGEAEVWYYDESGFCLTPCVPYAWQKKGKPLTAESVKSKRLNVAGFMNKNNILTAYVSECDISSEAVIACTDNFYENSENKSKKIYYNG